jgi:hypothetical protein
MLGPDRAGPVEKIGRVQGDRLDVDGRIVSVWKLAVAMNMRRVISATRRRSNLNAPPRRLRRCRIGLLPIINRS